MTRIHFLNLVEKEAWLFLQFITLFNRLAVFLTILLVSSLHFLLVTICLSAFLNCNLKDHTTTIIIIISSVKQNVKRFCSTLYFSKKKKSHFPSSVMSDHKSESQLKPYNLLCMANLGSSNVLFSKQHTTQPVKISKYQLITHQPILNSSITYENILKRAFIKI